MPFDKFFHLAFRQSAHEAVNGPSILEGENGRNGLDLQTLGNLRMLINVDLDQRGSAFGALHHFFDNRTKLFAGAAPGGPEIHKNKPFLAGFHHILHEGLCRAVLDQIVARTGALANQSFHQSCLPNPFLLQ
jgi:hypothetical protein